MARVVGPLMSEEASGPLGGLLFRRGTYGAIVSRTSSSPSLQSKSQLLRRRDFHRAIRAWTNLSAKNKSTYSALAAAPSTGRNLFVAGFCKLARANLNPSLVPKINRPDSHIHNPIADRTSGQTPTLFTMWQSTALPSDYVYIYVLCTWSNRAMPKPAKFKYLTSSRIDTLGNSAALPFQAPVVWVRFEVIDRLTGRMIQSFVVQAGTI